MNRPVRTRPSTRTHEPLPRHARLRGSVAVWTWLLFGSCASVLAQAPTNSPATIGDDVIVAGSVRIRSYSWNWFGDSANGDYTYPGSLVRVGLSSSRKAYDWQAEFAVPLIFELPTTAVMAAPQGQLGLGASYFVANSSSANTAAIFLKQGYVRFKGLGGHAGQSLTVGRLEFNDGTEVTPKSATLAALKRDRIGQRLLGNFGFSDVGRSIDGALYSLSGTSLNLTVLAGRPTQGVFEVNGWPELNVNVVYGALTGQISNEQHPGEWRLFALGYEDYRRGLAKTDNRPSAARSADGGSIAIGTYGGHYLQVAKTGVGSLDVLLWGSVQTGSWGALTQRAGAFAAEAGWQPAGLDALKPWFRGGYDYGSGDGSASDRTHGTFFQVLPTPRPYARLPFFNMMNSKDAFGEVMLRPSKSVTVRSDIHGLRLANENDLWYSGGGAFQATSFGYTGRPSGGQASLATLYDASADYAVNPHVALGLYYGYASGHGVIQSIYPAGRGAHLGYVEFFLRF